MWKTALALIVTIIVIPILAFTPDEPLTNVQQGILFKLQQSRPSGLYSTFSA